jgi:hypothetical protein
MGDRAGNTTLTQATPGIDVISRIQDGRYRPPDEAAADEAAAAARAGVYVRR